MGKEKTGGDATGKAKPISAAKAHYQAVIENEPVLVAQVNKQAQAVIGRPTSYDESIANEICARMGNGESIRNIVQSDNMPARGTVYAWQARNPLFQDRFARARESQAECLLDDCIAIADDICKAKPSDDKSQAIEINEQIQIARLQIDTRLRLAAKYAPHKYGDRIQHTGPNGGPIQVAAVTIDARSLAPDQRDALREALLAVKAQQNQALTIDGTAEEQSD